MIQIQTNSARGQSSRAGGGSYTGIQVGTGAERQGGLPHKERECQGQRQSFIVIQKGTEEVGQGGQEEEQVRSAGYMEPFK